jgi:hypothetical protein
VGETRKAGFVTASVLLGVLALSLVLIATVSWAHVQSQIMDREWARAEMRSALRDAGLQGAVSALGGAPVRMVFVPDQHGGKSFYIGVYNELEKHSLFGLSPGEFLEAVEQESEASRRALSRLRQRSTQRAEAWRGLAEELSAQDLSQETVTCLLKHWTGLSINPSASQTSVLRGTSATGTILNLEVIPAEAQGLDLGYDLVVLMTGREDQPIAIAGEHYFQPSVRRLCR